MAVTSIWSIKGWIGKVINYAENPDKTKENNEGRISENQSRSTQGLNDVITYAVNAEKIRRRQSESMEMELVGEAEELMEQYVSGVNCAPTTAREEMIAVKKRFGKEDGIVAFHGYQSFAPGECNPAMAHEIGKKLAEELWGSQYVSCASYMLCKKYGMDTSRYNFLHAPEFFEKMETQEVRVELSRARDAANAISARMAKVLDQNRNATYRQSETEKTGQDSSENVKDKKENPEPEKKEQKSRGQHRKEAR